MSLSICSGGMPEKKVATATTGMSIDGNISTGMRPMLTTPITATNRQTTTIRYGVLMAKRDIRSASFSGVRRIDQSGARLLSVGQVRMTPDGNVVSFIESACNL